MKAAEVTLGDLMASGVKMVAPETALGAAAQKMVDSRCSSLVVLQGEKAIGVLTERDLVRLLRDKETLARPVSEIMSTPVITARADEAFREGLLLMRQYGLRHLAVVDRADKVCGIVSETDLRGHLGMDLIGKVQNLFAAMDRLSPSMPPETPLSAALERMLHERWDYVVVVQHERALGIVTERDIPRFLAAQADIDTLTLRQAMSSPVKSVSLGASLFDAVRQMATLHLRHLVVVDGDGLFVGVISQHGLLERVGLEYIGDSLHDLEILRAGRIAAERALREREEVYRTLVDQAADSIVLIDTLTLGFPEFNAVAHENLGYSREEFSALTLPDLQMELNPEQVRQRIRQIVDKGGVSVFEIAHKRKDGSIRHTRVSNRPVTIRGRIYLSAIWEDITERKLAEEALRSSEQKLRGLYELSPLGIALVDMKGNYIDFNEAFERICGYPKEELLRLDYWTLTPEKYADDEAEQLRCLEEYNCYGPYEKEYRQKNGTLIPIRLNGMLVTGEDGKRYIWSIVEDISARVAADAQLRLAAHVFHDASEGIMITDAEGVMLDVNRAFTSITGYQRKDVAGRTPRILKSGRQGEAYYAALWRQLQTTGYWRGELWNRHKDGGEFAEKLSISAVTDANGAVTHYVGIFSDITEHKRQQEQIERLAYYDALTHLPNRVLLADRMRQAIALADRAEKVFAVCYLDLDGFKPINDRYGHKAGDTVLVEIAARLQKLIRAEDTVARLGGDEFVLLLTGLAREEESELILARLLEDVTRPCRLDDGIEVSVSASIGVTFYPTDHNDSDVLLRHADQAMYQAKQLGRNRMQSFSSRYDQQAKRSRELKSRVRNALTQGDFRLYWQPKVDLDQGRVIGAEALLRWKQADASVMLPGEFLPELENDDLIVEIGDYVIREGVAALSRWRERGLDLTASINVAARQLLSPSFMHKLRDVLEGRAELAVKLELEIVETTALEDLDKVKGLIGECDAMGISTALDDFGTGYSSMTYFRRLPVNTVKVDQSFVRDMLENGEDMAIVQGILGLTQAFGKTAVAEGVEQIENLAMLKSMGCHIAQGYAISRPLPEEDFLHWMTTYKPDSSLSQVH